MDLAHGQMYLFAFAPVVRSAAIPTDNWRGIFGVKKDKNAYRVLLARKLYVDDKMG